MDNYDRKHIASLQKKSELHLLKLACVLTFWWFICTQGGSTITQKYNLLNPL